MANYAPIIVFAYNRVDKLENLLKSLESNDNTQKMDMFIFVDIPDKKDLKNKKYNNDVQEFVFSYKENNNSFKNIEVFVADVHKGLAESIIYGVTKVINQYKKAIVLEDDLVVSNDFLDYMQRGLKYYENNKKIWSIAAYTPRLKVMDYYKKDIYIAPRIESLGWGTWVDRWNRTDWNVNTYQRFQRDFVGHLIFNLGGNDLCKMLKKQMTEKNYDSWAIRWCYQQFLERKYTVFPKENRVIHCGNDNRSTHGVYIGNQSIKEKYNKCKFENVKVNWPIVLAYRKENSTPLLDNIKMNLFK